MAASPDRALTRAEEHDPEGAAARGAGYLHSWITAGLLTGVSGDE